ncbi:SDR family oxidoreductase [Nesterenkonia alkaliphila]|uniref:Glucose 1-dehydrogenase n=1 Tax=Nesterenkonia alkaliphila TaxID=1463631 RepID=A0A7K1UEU5_9MICC|nr:SDR family oxidoreductase [Nesterenkonia alkaliphila]MVT24969.1 glucose 1-dehydrogenase [Nesterenkonia alkaliphila]GFZ86993.1 3-oxoacyl-ACP reductase [Nesterenkonia alkaliphila]
MTEQTIEHLTGQTALITGASRGIGLSIAQRLAAAGATVVITARKQAGLDAALEQLPEGALGIAGKADSVEHQEEVLETIAARTGRLDILINNAGINPVYGPVAEVDLDAARKVLEVNVLAGLSWVQRALVHARLGFREHSGRVVFLSSVTGEVPSNGIGIYGVSKAAVSHLTRTLAVELGPEVRVNAVAPAVVKTSFARALYEGKEDQVAADYPLKRLGVPEDVSGAVEFLVSDSAGWITGQVLTLDGGLTVAGGTA